jgi:hypothetical protein
VDPPRCLWSQLGATNRAANCPTVTSRGRPEPITSGVRPPADTDQSTHQAAGRAHENVAYASGGTGLLRTASPHVTPVEWAPLGPALACSARGLNGAKDDAAFETRHRPRGSIRADPHPAPRASGNASSAGARVRRRGQVLASGTAAAVVLVR